MKHTFAVLLALCAIYFANAQPGSFIPGYDKEIDDEAIYLFPPYETIHSGRELPRSFTVAYPDEESARAGSLEPSLYLQPLTVEPKTTDTGTHIEYTWNYKVPFAWVGRMVSLYIGSADNPYWVIVNGEVAGNNQSSRSPAEFDITARSKEGINTLTIKVEKDPQASLLTAAKGSGKITGEVFIQSQPRIRVRDYVYEVNFSSDEPTVQLGIILKTQMLNPRSVRIHYTLRDKAGVTVSSGHRDAQVGLKEEDTVRFFLTLKDLKPWSYETPQTYDLTIKNQYEGRYTEYVNYHTGFRNFTMHDGSLYTNGYRLPLAFYMMADVPAADNLVGALIDIKKQGYNVIIGPRYPLSEDFFRACNDIGLYVCNQADINTFSSGNLRTPDGNPSNDPRWAESYVDRAFTMYGSSANHPSVAMFSIARGSSNGYNLYESYLALKEMEDQRPVIYPEADGEWNSDAVTKDFAAKFPESAGTRLILDPSVKGNAYSGKTYGILTMDTQGNCRLENNSLITKLRGEIVYTVKKGKKKVSEGTIPVTLEPGTSGEYKIPVPPSVESKKIKFETKLVSNFD